ncbi:hypothetical protein [Streptomyces rochei]|uniref:hypothetical protein n=1 Tax=Streptomyces rochei TaxID=1928 RepID=UPI003678A1A0
MRLYLLRPGRIRTFDTRWRSWVIWGGEVAEHQGETPWQSLLARLVAVVVEVRA